MRNIEDPNDPNSTAENPLAGFVVQDCAIPLALGPLMLPMMTLLPNHRPPWNAFQRASKTAASFGSKLFGPYFSDGSIARTPAYLVMSHDSKLVLQSSISERILICMVSRQSRKTHAQEEQAYPRLLWCWSFSLSVQGS